MLLSHHQHVGQNQEIEIANRSLDLFGSVYIAMVVMCEHMNLAYHKGADIFCTAIVTIVTTVSSGRFLDVKATTL
jgi:hypothetical protein